MTTICIVILSRNRPLFLEEAILSALRQTKLPKKIIVSDNSTVEKSNILKLKKKYNEVEFIFNDSNEHMADHYLRVLKNFKYDLIAICHDDDLLMPKYIEEVCITYRQFQNATIISVNGKSLKDKNVSKEMMWKSKKKYVLVKKDQLFERWFNIDSDGVAPVSATVFNTNILKTKFKYIKPDKNYGKNYWDTFFFLKIIENSFFVWINKDLIRYRIHDSSVSNNSNLDYKIAYNLIVKNLNLNSYYAKILKKYRYIHLLINLINRRKFFYKFIAIKLFLYLLIFSNYFKKSIFSKKIYKYLRKVI